MFATKKYSLILAILLSLLCNDSKAESGIIIPSVSGTTVSGDISFDDNADLIFGSADDFSCSYNTAQTPDALVCGVSTDSETIIFAQKADVATDFAFPDQGTATIVLQNSDQATPTKRMYMQHNGTNGVITADAGVVSVSPGIVLPSASASALAIQNGAAANVVLVDSRDIGSFSGNQVQVQMTGNGGAAIVGSGDQYRILRADATLTSGTQTELFRGAHIQVKASGAAISSGAAGVGLRGAHFACIWDSTGTADNCYGIQTNAVLLDGSSSVAAGTVQKIVGNEATIGYSSSATGTGTAVNAYGMYVNSPQNTSAGRTITNAHGLYIENFVATGVTSGNAITTGTGKINFGDNVYFTSTSVIDAASYVIGRDADSPSQMHFNVPTSRTFEFSVNDVPEYILSATDFNINNNSLSNIGSSGTDFTTEGALVIGNNASAIGTTSLTINQGAHTAITGNQPALSASNFTNTVNSGSTIATASVVDIGSATYVGVAGGGAETVTDAASLRIAGPAVQGADVTVTNAMALLVDNGTARFDGFIQSNPQIVTGADDGAGTPALVTVTPSSNIIQITCNDANNCNITMSETGQRNGVSIKLVNMSANPCVFADTGGVSELAGGFTAGQYDSISMTYQVDRWVEDGRSNN